MPDSELAKSNAKNKINSPLQPDFSLQEGDEHDEIDTANVEIEYLSRIKNYSTTGLSVTNNMMTFDDRGTFLDFMEEYTTKCDSLVLDFATSWTGFTSLRTYYEELMEDEYIDDYDLDLERIEDTYFESILNSNREFRIEDTVYVYDANFDSVLFYQVDDFDNVSISNFKKIVMAGTNCDICSELGTCK